MKPDMLQGCPVPPYAPDTVVQMAHGGGGRKMQRLIDEVFTSSWANPALLTRHDSALLSLPATCDRIAMTTDSYVVHPLFFSGGSIASLAVNGTVNDLAMGGARPLWLSAGFILEEGTEISTLHRIAAEMQECAARAGVAIVTGDTKVVERGHGDSVFVNTTGVGVLEHASVIGPSMVEPGDAVIVSGDLGRHGIAIMAAREGLVDACDVVSDCAPVAAPVMDLLAAGLDIHCMRDLTRGGLASAMVEIAEQAGVQIQLEEAKLQVTEAVRATCELLGFDPLFVANEGRFIVILPASQANTAQHILASHHVSMGASVAGTVTSKGPGRVSLLGRFGTERIVDMLSGEQLPRIC